VGEANSTPIRKENRDIAIKAYAWRLISVRGRSSR